jgi:hypothetical protein
MVGSLAFKHMHRREAENRMSLGDALLSRRIVH